MAGPLEGRSLREIPSVTTTWKEWRASHPDTLVLRKPTQEMVADIRRRSSSYAGYHEDPERIGVAGTENPDPRLPGKRLVFGMEGTEGSAAVPLTLLEKKPVLNTEIFGRPAVVFSPPGESAAMAYVRTVDGEELVFEQAEGADGRLVARESESGSTWSWETGECLQGAFEGRRLERIPGTVAYWGVWAQFHPRTEVVRSGF